MRTDRRVCMAVEWQVGCDLAVQNGHFWRLRSGGKGGLGEVVAALDADGQVMPSWLAGPGSPSPWPRARLWPYRANDSVIFSGAVFLNAVTGAASGACPAVRVLCRHRAWRSR